MEIKRRYVVDARRPCTGIPRELDSERTRCEWQLEKNPLRRPAITGDREAATFSLSFSLSLSLSLSLSRSVSLCLAREARALLLSIPRKRVASGDRRVNLALSA